jgi:septal ring factor EnvC (AmiA/AmiB activator)
VSRRARRPDQESHRGLKAGLDLPARGELASRFAVHESGGGTRGKKWLIRCTGGLAVRAAAVGQVVYAEWLRGFGNLLIIDHGDGYMSLFGDSEALLSPVRRQRSTAAR